MFSKILVFALIAFFAVSAVAQETIPSAPVSDFSLGMNDDEEYLEDTTDEPTVEIPGALCFHEESLSVYDREMLKEYTGEVRGLKFIRDCLREETRWWKEWKHPPISVPESFLTMPGSYVSKLNLFVITFAFIDVALLLLLGGTLVHRFRSRR